MALPSMHSRIKLIRATVIEDGPKGVSKYAIFSHDLDPPTIPYLISTLLVLSN